MPEKKIGRLRGMCDGEADESNRLGEAGGRLGMFSGEKGEIIYGRRQQRGDVVKRK